MSILIALPPLLKYDDITMGPDPQRLYYAHGHYNIIHSLRIKFPLDLKVLPDRQTFFVTHQLTCVLMLIYQR